MTVLDYLFTAVSFEKRVDRPLIVGINGIDGSGKTTLAGGLAARLSAAGHSVCVISVDDFHRPRAYRSRRGAMSPEAFRYDAVDLPSLASRTLSPIVDAESFPIEIPIAIWDIDADAPAERYATVTEASVVIVEGVFLFEPPILSLLDLKLFVSADFDTILERVQVRDIRHFGSAEAVEARYRAKYIPGQQLYLDQVRPAEIADIVIDNNDAVSPRLLRGRAYPQP